MCRKGFILKKSACFNLRGEKKFLLMSYRRCLFQWVYSKTLAYTLEKIFISANVLQKKSCVTWFCIFHKFVYHSLCCRPGKVTCYSEFIPEDDVCCESMHISMSVYQKMHVTGSLQMSMSLYQTVSLSVTESSHIWKSVYQKTCCVTRC